MTLDGFRFHSLLGEGSYGKVVLASHTSTVKILIKNSIDYKDALNKSHILKEVCTSPLCICAYGTFQTKDLLFFVMEYLSGRDLENFLKERAPLTIEMTKFLTAEIICGLQSFHSWGIVHLDIKPENILLDSSGHVHLRIPYGFAADYFSLGVIVYEMVTGKYPFAYTDTNSDTNSDTVLDNDSDNDSDTFLDNGSDTDSDVDEVLLLCKCPNAREMHVKDLQSHPLFNGVDWMKLKAWQVSPPFDMETLPPMDLTTEMMMEEIIDPDNVVLNPELSEEDQDLYSSRPETKSA
ncbi:protein kinase C delta type-like [Aquarana catesbeiana]|uniref:protein kinase C delta type-like n=1 Tax=Aquarana catesbeiana TaxID=8400 RepID=UPI003CC9F2B2